MRQSKKKKKYNTNQKKNKRTTYKTHLYHNTNVLGATPFRVDMHGQHGDMLGTGARVLQYCTAPVTHIQGCQVQSRAPSSQHHPHSTTRLPHWIHRRPGYVQHNHSHIRYCCATTINTTSAREQLRRQYVYERRHAQHQAMLAGHHAVRL